jgi:hypothetical protein
MAKLVKLAQYRNVGEPVSWIGNQSKLGERAARSAEELVLQLERIGIDDEVQGADSFLAGDLRARITLTFEGAKVLGSTQTEQFKLVFIAAVRARVDQFLRSRFSALESIRKVI